MARSGSSLNGRTFTPIVCALVCLVGCEPVRAETSPCNRVELERMFVPRFNAINHNIKEKQLQIDRMIATDATDGEIRMMTQELIRWRARRDTLAIDYILRMRRDDCPTSDPNPMRSR